MAEPIVFEDTISYMLAKVAVAYRTAIERHMMEIGLHSGQTFLLIELWREDGIRQVDLAKRLNVTAPTVSTMLIGLRKIKLIQPKKKDDGDGRSSRVFLTERGLNIRSEVERRWVDVEAECIAGLPATDRFVLHEVLKKLRATYTGQKQPDEE